MPTTETDLRRRSTGSGIPRWARTTKNWSRTNSQLREERRMAYETLFCETECAYTIPLFAVGDAGE